MTSMALAATLFGPEDLRMVERPLDPLASGMVRIRFGAGGICGSDMHYYRHARTGDFVVTSPLVLGHEIAGEVVEISGSAPGLKTGDRVAGDITGKRAVLFGSGPIGLLTMLAARRAGIAETTVVDIAAAPLAFATRLGANHVIDISKGDEALKAVAPYDVAFEVSGTAAGL